MGGISSPSYQTGLTPTVFQHLTYIKPPMTSDHGGVNFPYAGGGGLGSNWMLARGGLCINQGSLQQGLKLFCKIQIFSSSNWIFFLFCTLKGSVLKCGNFIIALQQSALPTGVCW